MKYKINDIVRIIDKSAFYYNALGRIMSITDDEFAYYVVFEMIDEDTNEVSIYEDCFYKENQIIKEDIIC